MCGNQFTPGEQRLQQWANRNTQRAYVHAHGITGGIGRDHERVSKAATDNEARDTVVPFRDSGHRRPQLWKWSSPFTRQMDDNSTEAPDDDDRLFDREEALRHDDAIMDFQWFNTIPWAEIEDLRGHGDSGLPCSRRSTPSLRAIMHHGPSSPNSEPAWKVLLLSSWLFLDRPAENASGANCASVLETRLELSWTLLQSHCRVRCSPHCSRTHEIQS